ncbi:MAG TPA: tetratricopeptide repeat protein [Thermoanaerobaculia bacterium]|nr:tetratricopeptide repeat protein [Thermoanaerobaculia bacterium]
MRRRSSWILVSSLAALTAIVAIATLAAAPPNLTKALEAQRRLAAERPQDAAVLNDLGNLLMLVPQPAEAEAAYRKAIELDPNKASALFNLGLLLQQRGELREAYDLYERAVKADPNHAWAYYQLGTIQEVRGQTSKAVDSYARAFALDPQLAFPEVNPHIVDNKLVTQAMLRAYKSDYAPPQAPKMYDDASRIASLLVPPPAQHDESKDQPAAGQGQQRQPAAPGRAGQGTAPPSQGPTVIREQNLDRRNTTGQTAPPGAAVRGGRPISGAQVQPRGLREWNRPEPTIQEVPGGDEGDGAQPQPVIAPPAGGVYYRPGIQSTGRMNMLVVPDWARKGGRR